MLAKVNSLSLQGIDGYAVQVEVNLSAGMPAFDIVGLPDAAVKEARERVRAALKNSGFGFPSDRLTVNLAPADVKKEGPLFDLPIAVGVLSTLSRIGADGLKSVAMFGELSLDGEVRPVRGALPLAIAAKEMGYEALIVPEGNAGELACVSGIRRFSAKSLKKVVAHLRGEAELPEIPTVEYGQLLGSREAAFDFSDVKGQSGAKRALEIAAAGGHNVLMIGPPGSGKTLLARCVPTILPNMTFEEALEVTRIHSACGIAPESGLITERPFRSPHHTASSVSLVGGGANAMPGELSKAHHGVLFLDELPEYKRDALEVLRQPMEDGFVTVTRVAASSTYPSSFMLVCSMNPCPCGHYGSRDNLCRCTPNEIRRYINKISGPLLDRIDLHIEVESVPADRISDERQEEPSSAVRARIQSARELQRERYKDVGIACNAMLNARTLKRFTPMKRDAAELLKSACESMGFSNRVFTRLIKVARTIADLSGADEIALGHVAEAVQYRSLDSKYWKQ